MQEEIGFRSEQLTLLGELRPWSKYLSVRTFVYLACNLIPSALKGDEDYEIKTERVHLDKFESLITSGRLTDARVIAALYLTRRHHVDLSSQTLLDESLVVEWC